MKKYIIEPAEGKSLVAAMGVTLTKTFDYSDIYNKLIRLDLLWKTSTTFTFTTFNIDDLDNIRLLAGSGLLGANTLNTWNNINSQSGSGTNTYAPYNLGQTGRGIGMIGFPAFKVLCANSAGAMTGEMFLVAYTSEEDND